MTEHDTAAVIECVSLTKVFKDFWGRDKVLAVDQLDLDVRAGEVFGLLGPNGSGKSTTIKVLLGLLYPTSGRARVLGRPPTDTQVKARIGFLPEESYLYRFLTARETLEFYGRLFNLDRRDRRRRIDQLIEMVGLKKAARRPVGQFSKGMARRIGLAQALINDPDLLILDEPTSGLDPIGSRQIKDVIEELARRGKTVLLSSHLLADVEDLCDRVAILYGGRLQALGTVPELLARRDVLQIRVEGMRQEKIARLRELIEQSDGARVLAVENPTDRLEDFFLRVVGAAQRERLATSGAESAGGVSEFLAAPADAPPRGRQLLERLAARPDTATAASAGEPAPAQPTTRAPDAERLASLLAESAAPQAAPVEDEELPSAAGPRPLKSPQKADRSVIERLVDGSERPPTP